jgi:hypothetical protein
MNRLYQWLSERASIFRSGTPGKGVSHIVRTEVTVERRGTTLLVGDMAAADFDTCPLCGVKLAPAEAEQTRLRLNHGSIAQDAKTIERPSP